MLLLCLHRCSRIFVFFHCPFSSAALWIASQWKLHSFCCPQAKWNASCLSCLISLLFTPPRRFINEALASPGRSSTKEFLANLLPISKVSHFCHLWQGMKRQLAYWNVYLTSTLGYRILSLHSDLGLIATDVTVISRDRQRGVALPSWKSWHLTLFFFIFYFWLCLLIKRDSSGLS